MKRSQYQMKMSGGEGKVILHKNNTALDNRFVFSTLSPISMPKLTSLILTVLIPSLWAITASPHAFREKQPDGSFTPELHMNGNIWNHVLTDNEGYVVMKNRKNKWLVYASFDALTGKLNPTNAKVGKGSPNIKGFAKTFQKIEDLKSITKCEGRCLEEKQKRKRYSPFRLSRKLKNTNSLKNLVVLLRFSDHVDRDLPSRSNIDKLMNQIGGDRILAPTGSVRDVYTQSSYDQFSIDSTVYPWITLPNTEAYYTAGNNGKTLSIFIQAIHFALDLIDQDSNFHFKDFDQDNDGIIDAITLIQSGYGAEWGSTDCYGQPASNRVWSHKRNLYAHYQWTSNDGVKVDKYHISPAMWKTCGSSIGRIGVIAHELGHFLGLPDLYDGFDGKGIGSYCLMSNAWGIDGTQYHPPILSPWSKIQLGWTIPTLIDVSGFYDVHASATNNQIYRIDAGYPEGEYLLLENRQKIGFDERLPGGGLAIWHIDENASQQSPGFPGQIDWPFNGEHYHVSLLQADGNYDLEKGINYGDAADLYFEGEYNSIGPSTSDMGPYPNTDSYQNGKIKDTGIRIYNISKASQQMSFMVSIPVQKKTIATTFDWNRRQAGNMFDIYAKKALTIYGFDIHTKSTKMETVKVYTRSGSYIGFESQPDAWTLIGTVDVQGSGGGKTTPLPKDAIDPVKVEVGMKQAFYVTLLSRFSMMQTKGREEGEIFVANGDMEIYEGCGNKDLFGKFNSPRIFNGVIHYI